MSRFKNILVVYKPSTYQSYNLDRNASRVKALRLKGDVYVKRLLWAHEQHRDTLELVKKTLREKGLSFALRQRKWVGHLTGYDLVVTVGGDGTFLRTSHAVTNQLMLGINSAPSISRGALCSITGHEFPEKLEEILAGHYKVKKLTRLQIAVNDKLVPIPALNDVLFANRCPAGTSRYSIRIGTREEHHTSSGVWVATASGSTAAIKAAGGKILQETSPKIQYFVREPYGGRHHYRLVQGMLGSKQTIEFASQMVTASLYIDGTQKIIPVGFGDRVVIGRSPVGLRCVV